MAWNLVYLAAYPDVQIQLYEEIITRSSEETSALKKYIGDNDTYLAACIKETARHRPIVGQFPFESNVSSFKNVI